MKRLFSIIAITFAFATLAGCGALQTKLNQDIQSVAEPDLQNALAIEQAQATPAPERLMCWGGLLTYTKNLPTAASSTPLPTVNGVASLIEIESIAAGQLADAQPILPPLDKQTEAACLLVLAENGAAKVKLAAIVAGIGKGKGILSAAQALKAADSLAHH